MVTGGKSVLEFGGRMHLGGAPVNHDDVAREVRVGRVPDST
jgi:hypothetical protein